ncbi:TonB family protein [Acinetobacter modestus]|uniref:TonB family protein n=1 Tax=Acinetobacter modestus TaxID=1776740 RepID=UPI003B96E393
MYKFFSAESFPEVSKPLRIINNVLYWSRSPKIIFNKNDLEGQDRSILVSVIANEQGKITEAKILRSSGLSKLDIKALNATKAAKFKPFYVGGKYHTINVVLPFQFHYE